MYTIEQVRRLVPSAFATEAYHKMSDNYTYIPTAQIIQAMIDEGYGVSSAGESRTRIEDKRGHTKHMLRFRQNGQGSVQVGDVIPEIVLVNSHDGTSTYKLMAGMFRLVCSNGLTVSDGMIEAVNVRHVGDITGQVIEGSYRLLERMPETLETVNEWRNIELSEGEQNVYADAAMKLRYEDESEAPIASNLLLWPRRHADRSNNLWTTFNRVQENMMKGEFRSRFSGRRTRAVQNIGENVRLNRALWELTQKMAELKG